MYFAVLKRIEKHGSKQKSRAILCYVISIKYSVINILYTLYCKIFCIFLPHVLILYQIQWRNDGKGYLYNYSMCTFTIYKCSHKKI